MGYIIILLFDFVFGLLLFYILKLFIIYYFIY
nr:MAG TPA: hypothetical protein [Caudoviricetes sp.]